MSEIPGSKKLGCGCDVCDHTGWVCENHRELPWGEMSDDPDACSCGAGAPCVCNDLDPLAPKMMPEQKRN